ncbi:unnamed protein product [Adineta steineri]|uniref:LysM domain-containing protein n=1 Tax=Adineta steineri TaxID=433720 RepID=A0A814YHN2_9BILA|nr:unnamed protein product [Adineta steineri]CAF1229324.1 unnamed protein product [Adineta steineri]
MNALSEPLLSSSENDSNNIELGTLDSDDDDDVTKLNTQRIVRSRHIKQQSTPAAHGGGSIVIVEKPILPQESLQAFAIRYRVPISQLKRLNNLQNDQDFYGLKYCRVPVRRFGILHEQSSTIVDLHEQLTTNTTVPITHLTQQNHHAFLNAMDQDLALMRAKVEQLIETPTTTLIPDQPKTVMMIRSTIKAKNDFSCDGADCGCRFWHILGAIILIALLIPIIYIYIYIKSPPTLIEHFP